MKSLLTLTSAACIAFGFSSCAPTNNAQYRAGQGAAAGAVLGGIIGHQSGRALEGAAAGAAVGGVGGAVIGNQEDKKQQSGQ